MAIDKKINYNMQGNVKNYLGKQKMVKAPLHWQSAPNHPKTELAYITDAEKKLLIKKDLHKSLHGGVNRGPAGIMSLNGWGSKDDSGREVGMSGAATSAAESGKHTSDTLAAGLSNKDLQDYRSGFIAAGGGQNVNPGWFGPRNRVSRDELRAARAFAPGAYRATRGSGIGGLLRGALGFLGGIPGRLISAGLTAKDWAQNRGSNLLSGIQEFSEYPTLEKWWNRDKVQAIKPIETMPTNEQIIGDRIGEYWRLPQANTTMPNNLTNNMGVNNQFNDPYFLAPGAKDGGRIGYRTAGPVLGDDESSETIFEFMQDQGIPSGEMVSNEWNDRLLEQLYDKFIDQGFSPADAEKMALEELELMSQGPEQDQGIASLV